MKSYKRSGLWKENQDMILFSFNKLAQIIIFSYFLYLQAFYKGILFFSGSTFFTVNSSFIPQFQMLFQTNILYFSFSFSYCYKECRYLRSQIHFFSCWQLKKSLSFVTYSDFKLCLTFKMFSFLICKTTLKSLFETVSHTFSRLFLSFLLTFLTFSDFSSLLGRNIVF